MKLSRPRPLLPLLLLALLGPALAGPLRGAAPAAEGRVVVLGFDGAGHATVQEQIEAGALPNLARLAHEGTFAPLATTLNAESAVAWAALNSGQNPSKTGVPGFILRRFVDETFQPVETGGLPSPGLGYQRTEERPLAELDAGPVLSLLGRYGAPTLAAAVGGVVLVLFLVAFRLLLRLRRTLSLALALVLAGVGVWATLRAGSYAPRTVPGIVANPIETAPYWEVAAHAGVKSVVLDAAMSWDREPVEGAEVLAGLGLPDARGGNGDWFVYSTDDLELDRPPEGRTRGLTAGAVFRVDWRDERIETEVFGPLDFVGLERTRDALLAVEGQLEDNEQGWKEGERLREETERLRAEVGRLEKERLTQPLVVERRAPDRYRITIGDHAQEISADEWSDFYHLSFELNPLIKVAAVTRVRVLSTEPFRLFVNVLDTDPAAPPFWQPISQPPGFSAELARDLGRPFETFGWACATMPFKSDEISAEVLLEDLEFTLRWREGLLDAAFEREDWRLLSATFSTPDRLQHMLYQFYDPEHPLYDAESAARRTTFFGEEIALSEALPAIFRQVDRLVGKVLEQLDPEDTLLICADHGFQSFRHQFHVNNWLEQNGYLVMREGVRTSERKLLGYVDWSKTRAYALGLGTVYLNIAGRERDGIVPPEDADRLMREIAARLEQATDTRPGHVGTPAVTQVRLFKDVHGGPFLDREGDLMIGFAPHYRVSWATTMGDIALEKDSAGQVVTSDVFEPNDNPWSGGHVSVAPTHVAGVFFSNRQLALPEGGAHLLHVAPTALGFLGVEVPSEMDLAPLRPR